VAGVRPDGVQVSLGVGAEAVDRNDNRDPELAHIDDMAGEISQAGS
jgi:hypothetical protein